MEKYNLISERQYINMYITGNLNSELDESVKKMTNKEVKEFMKMSRELISNEIDREILEDLRRISSNI